MWWTVLLAGWIGAWGSGGLEATGLMAAPPKLELVAPESAGMRSTKLREIDGRVETALKAEKLPGCVIAIGHSGKLTWRKAYGARQLQPERLPMTEETVFDLASLTKAVATTTCVMRLVEEGKLKLDEPVANHLPEFARQGKETVTIRQLLTHTGGLVADNPLRDFADGATSGMSKLLAAQPQVKPGERFQYSDVGFIVLGELAQRTSGARLDQYSREVVFSPLGMRDTGYLPGVEQRKRAAATEKRGDHWMQGEVHDPRAFALGGVAGHAGLFGTADDLAVFAQMLLGKGEYAGVRVLRAETVDAMLSSQAVPGGVRTLGWDRKTGFSTQRGRGFSARAFGHGGFTGTSLWIDPELDLFVVFLSNRVHPDGKGAVNSLAGEIGTIAAEGLIRQERDP